jgi:hypothetical protein
MTGTPVITKGMLPPPPPPPASPPAVPVSDAIMMSEAKDLSQSAVNHSG